MLLNLLIVYLSHGPTNHKIMTLVNGTCGHDVVYRRRVSPRQPLSVATVWFIEIKDNNFCSPLTKGNHRYDRRVSFFQFHVSVTLSADQRVCQKRSLLKPLNQIQAWAPLQINTFIKIHLLYHTMVQKSLESTTKIRKKNRPAYSRVEKSY